jgi:hypothetical protein
MKKLQIFICAVIALFYVTSVNAQDNSSNQAVLNAYYGVKNALINGDASATNVKAKALLAAISSFPAGKLSANDKSVWAKYADKLQFDSRHISESNDIEHQREHFASLSENMFAAAKAIKLNTATLYRDYCPMKKSYWLSETEAIQNPYYGKEMPTCGAVKETLPALSK